MKLFAILGAMLLVTGISAFQKKEKKMAYFYCYSHATNPRLTEKEVILYTEVSSITDENDNVKNKTAQWGAYVDKHCANRDGCTSDLNYYPTMEDAVNSFNKIRVGYGDTSRFVLKLVKFK